MIHEENKERFEKVIKQLDNLIANLNSPIPDEIADVLDKLHSSNMDGAAADEKPEFYQPDLNALVGDYPQVGEADIGDLYETENPIIDGAPEHFNCPCHFEPVVNKNDDRILELSFNDLDVHELALLGLDPLIKNWLCMKRIIQK